MPDFHFSNRTDWSLHNNPLSDSLEQLRKQGDEILDLTESNPTRCGFHYPAYLLKALAELENLSYVPISKGMINAREAIAEYYTKKNIAIDPEDLVLTSSTSEGYSFLLKLLTNPGDHVLIPKPSYPLFQFLLELADVEFDYYPLVYDGQWRINREAFKSLVKSKTKAVIVVNPNNPTGSYVDQGDIAFLNEQCLKNSMAIISDEVFFDYNFSPPNDSTCNPLSLASNRQVLTFVLSGVSKILGLPQMKLSWILTRGGQGVSQKALERLEIIADTYLSVNTPVQNALQGWLSGADQIQQEILQRVKDNLNYLRQSRLDVLAVQGGWYAPMYVPAIKDEEAFVVKLLQDQKVLVHPGYFFDFETGSLPAGRQGHIVLSLLPETQKFKHGVDKIQSFVV